MYFWSSILAFKDENLFFGYEHVNANQKGGICAPVHMCIGFSFVIFNSVSSKNSLTGGPTKIQVRRSSHNVRITYKIISRHKRSQ